MTLALMTFGKEKHSTLPKAWWAKPSVSTILEASFSTEGTVSLTKRLSADTAVGHQTDSREARRKGGDS